MADGRIRIFISSPGDVADERRRAAIVINRLAHEFARFFELTAVLWEYEPMLASGHFQDAIVRPSETDIVVLILWSRLGTPLPDSYRGLDGRAPVTGTEWEFEDALAHRRTEGVPDLLVYRKEAPGRAVFDREDQLEHARQQWRALQGFWKRHFVGEEGNFTAAFNAFRDLDGLEASLEQHLRQLLRQRLPAVEGRGGRDEITWTEGSPFRGLEAYQAEHAAIFFGRGQAEKQVIEAIARHANAGSAALFVLGASGSGKSSLLRAGVIPTLTVPGVVTGVSLWRRVLFRPGGAAGDVFERLAAALIGQALPELPEAGIDAAALARQWRAAPAQAALPVAVGLRAARRGNDAAASGAPRLVVLVDQFEEMFGLAEGERIGFVALLAALATSGEVWVLATLRSDFYQRIDDVPGLRELIGERQYSLPPLRPAEIAEIVRRPAGAAGLDYETDEASGLGLDAVIAEAAAADPAALPLLSFALDELYRGDVADGRAGLLTVATYRRLGGLEGAIAERAEEVCAVLPVDAVEAILRELVTLRDDQDEAAARPVSRAAATSTPERERVVDALIAARLVVSAGTRAGPVLRFAHEALIRHWPRLSELIAGDREFLRARLRLQGDRGRWQEEGRPPDLLLPPGKRLAEGAEILAARRGDLDGDTAAFVEASVVRDREVRGRQLRRARIVAASVGVLGVAAIGFGVFAEMKREQAATALVAAEQSLARSRGQEGSLALSQRRYDDAVAAFRGALQIREELVARGLRARFELRNIGVNHRDVANSLRAKDDLDGAAAEYRASQAAFEKMLAETPQDEQLRGDLAIDHVGLAELAAQQKNAAAARTEYLASIDALKALVVEDPKRVDWSNDLGIALYGYGDLLLSQGDGAGAAEQFAAALETYQGLATQYPQSAPVKLRLFQASFRLGLARHQQGDLAAALSALTVAEELAGQLKEGISAGEAQRLQQALALTRDALAAKGKP